MNAFRKLTARLNIAASSLVSCLCWSRHKEPAPSRASPHGGAGGGLRLPAAGSKLAVRGGKTGATCPGNGIRALPFGWGRRALPLKLRKPRWTSPLGHQEVVWLRCATWLTARYPQQPPAPFPCRPRWKPGAQHPGARGARSAGSSPSSGGVRSPPSLSPPPRTLFLLLSQAGDCPGHGSGCAAPPGPPSSPTRLESKTQACVWLGAWVGAGGDQGVLAYPHRKRLAAAPTPPRTGLSSGSQPPPPPAFPHAEQNSCKIKGKRGRKQKTPAAEEQKTQQRREKRTSKRRCACKRGQRGQEHRGPVQHPGSTRYSAGH
ncbi:BRD4-interacting chromatin-remodeling complex-associated protein-like [Cygnus olor]|uniref:BRD4-interacting chromatin-remodeling complex-associated protein-like n=1 Tax=Cygnus olor TaxID=8869 RepID=UPI001ADE1316|nr:BRD4-interacting chromatin-remodeling complex-associated protein-like [Cygnus olor]